MLTSLVAVQGDGLRLEYDANMQSRVVAAGPAEQALGPFMHSEPLLTATGALSEFALEDQHEDEVHDSLGDGVRVTLTGHAGQIAKIVEVIAYRQRPGWLFLRARYRNDGTT